MGPAEEGERIRIERLDSEAQRRDTCLLETGERRFTHVVGIGFKEYPAILCEPPAATERFHDTAKLRSGKKARRSAAEVESVEAGLGGPSQRNFGQEEVDVARAPDFGSDVDREVAVGAERFAERNVDV